MLRHTWHSHIVPTKDAINHGCLHKSSVISLDKNRLDCAEKQVRPNKFKANSYQGTKSTANISYYVLASWCFVDVLCTWTPRLPAHCKILRNQHKVASGEPVELVASYGRGTLFEGHKPALFTLQRRVSSCTGLLFCYILVLHIFSFTNVNFRSFWWRFPSYCYNFGVGEADCFNLLLL